MFIGIYLGVIFAITIISIIRGVEYVQGLRRQIELAKQTNTVEERTGHFVQVDCRECGKLNRIPADKVRHRPICGVCKHKLMPKRNITLYTVRNLEFNKALSLELDTVMDNYLKFWEVLDEHFKRKGVKATVIDHKDLPN